MTYSIFYNTQGGRRFPIPLLALETYSIQAGSTQTADELLRLFMMIASEICHVKAPSDDDIDYFVQRLQGVQDELKELEEPSETTKSFGTAFQEYLNKLTIDSTILRMTGYDFEAARKIYCELDRDDAMKLVNEYVSGLMQEGLLNLESAMYGQGGSYKDDVKSKPKANVHDLTTEEGRASLRSFGF